MTLPELPRKPCLRQNLHAITLMKGGGKIPGNEHEREEEKVGQEGGKASTRECSMELGKLVLQDVPLE